MNFKEAADKMSRLGISATEIASAAGVSLNSISRARIGTANSRPPPKKWKYVCHALILERASALSALAAELADA